MFVVLFYYKYRYKARIKISLCERCCNGCFLDALLISGAHYELCEGSHESAERTFFVFENIIILLHNEKQAMQSLNYEAR